MGLACVHIYMRLGDSWEETRSKNWPHILSRWNLEGGLGGLCGSAGWATHQKNLMMNKQANANIASGALHKGAVGPNRLVESSNRKSKGRWNSELQGSRPYRKMYLWVKKHKSLGYSSEGGSRFSGWAIRPMETNKIQPRAGRVEHQGTEVRAKRIWEPNESAQFIQAGHKNNGAAQECDEKLDLCNQSSLPTRKKIYTDKILFLLLFNKYFTHQTTAI